MFQAWLHTSLIPASGTIVLAKSDLDHAVKDKRHRFFPADFCATLRFEAVVAGEESDAAADAAPSIVVASPPAGDMMSSDSVRDSDHCDAPAGSSCASCRTDEDAEGDGEWTEWRRYLRRMSLTLPPAEIAALAREERVAFAECVCSAHSLFSMAMTRSDVRIAQCRD